VAATAEDSAKNAMRPLSEIPVDAKFISWDDWCKIRNNRIFANKRRSGPMAVEPVAVVRKPVAAEKNQRVLAEAQGYAD
jgi:hypothetical protein